MPREELLAHLTRLQNAGFLEPTRIMPNLEYSFRHSLIHDVAYGTLLKRRRRELHELAMAAIERRRANQLANKVELLARHAFHAENWPKALVYCRRAGLRAQAKSANLEAVGYFEQALQAAAKNPRTPRYQKREIDVRLELVQSLFTLGRHDQVQRQLLITRALAAEVSDQRRLADVTSSMILYHWVRGELDAAVCRGQEAMAMAEKLKDVKCEIEVATRLGGTYLDRGDYQDACRLLKVTVDKIPGRLSHNRFGLLTIAAVSSRASLARTLGELGHFAEAVEVGDEGIRIADEAGHAFSRIYAYVYVGIALLRKGDFKRSLPLLAQSLELSRASRGKLLFPLASAAFGYASVRSGDTGQGLACLEESFERADQQALVLRLSLQVCWLAEAYLLAGQLEEAHMRAKDALQLARQYGEMGHEAWALWLLGEIHSEHAMAAGDRAEAYFLKAREIACARHMRPLIAHTDLGLGRIHGKQRKWSEADLRIKAAISAYRSLDMTYWLEIAESAMDHVSRNASTRLKVG